MDQGDSQESRPGLSATLAIWLSSAAVLLAAAYLISITVGLVRAENRLGQMEVILFVAILALNPSVMSRLSRLNVTKEGISLDLLNNAVKRQIRPIQRQQKQQEALIDDLKVQQLELLQQQQQLDIDQIKMEIRSLQAQYLPADEIVHLVNLNRDEPVFYEKRDSFVNELRHLRALQFIKNLPGQKIADLPSRGNLRDFVELTDRGKELAEWWHEYTGGS